MPHYLCFGMARSEESILKPSLPALGFLLFKGTVANRKIRDVTPLPNYDIILSGPGAETDCHGDETQRILGQDSYLDSITSVC